MKIAFHTLGCKLNYSETSFILKEFQNDGMKIINFSEEADIYVINTCSVTENANKECQQIVRKVKKQSPKSIVAIMGCYAQLKPKEISKIKGVNLVIGSNEKFRLKKYIKEFLENKKTLVKVSDIKSITHFNNAFSSEERTRSFLKIQDGCDYKCTFCTIPLARGKSRSNNIEDIIQNIEKLKSKKIKEIVLTGVNIGDYGKKGEKNFYYLLQKIDDIDKIRIRISSIEPNLLSNQIIHLVANSKTIVPHFHIPLQSGSDSILKLMRRRYLTQNYAELIKKITKKMPHACIGSDVMVGFPGETDELFNETVNFIKSLPISYLHVFSYSERENTAAYNFKKIVPKEIRKKRSKILRNLSTKKRDLFYLNNLNTIRPTLIEKKKKNDSLYGYTDNYIKVEIPYEQKLENNIINIDIQKMNQNGIANGSIIYN
jgi:threonylcarbamoyladenosine tRNA methylthiotransferase MtaB